ncbi:hypothetical protein ABEP39_12295, partial [Cutibacterium acnes]
MSAWASTTRNKRPIFTGPNLGPFFGEGAAGKSGAVWFALFAAARSPSGDGEGSMFQDAELCAPLHPGFTIPNAACWR